MAINVCLSQLMRQNLHSDLAEVVVVVERFLAITLSADDTFINTTWEGISLQSLLWVFERLIHYVQ